MRVSLPSPTAKVLTTIPILDMTSGVWTRTQAWPMCLGIRANALLGLFSFYLSSQTGYLHSLSLICTLGPEMLIVGVFSIIVKIKYAWTKATTLGRGGASCITDKGRWSNVNNKEYLSFLIPSDEFYAPPTYRSKEEKLHSDFILRLLNKSWKEKDTVNFIKPKKFGIFSWPRIGTHAFIDTPWTSGEGPHAAHTSSRRKSRLGWRQQNLSKGTNGKRQAICKVCQNQGWVFRPTVFSHLFKLKCRKSALASTIQTLPAPRSRIILYISQASRFSLPPLWPDHNPTISPITFSEGIFTFKAR